MNDWNNDIEDDQLESECMREDDDDRAGRDEEETPDLLVMMGISETPMKDQLKELFNCLNPNL